MKTNNNDAVLFPEKSIKNHISTVSMFRRGVWIESQELLESLDVVLEQAKRVQNLEKLARHRWDEVHKRIQIIKRYREALEFYANKDSYNQWPTTDEEFCYIHDVDFDSGNKARKALEATENENSGDN